MIYYKTMLRDYEQNPLFLRQRLQAQGTSYFGLDLDGTLLKTSEAFDRALLDISQICASEAHPLEEMKEFV